MSTINITCQTCNEVYAVRRTDEIPAHVVSMKCNWCPNCEDQADDVYEEWYDENDSGDSIPIPIGDNQLCMPILFEELEDNLTAQQLTHDETPLLKD